MPSGLLALGNRRPETVVERVVNNTRRRQQYEQLFMKNFTDTPLRPIKIGQA